MTREAGHQWGTTRPDVLVFDVNETLIDFESMTAQFERIFNDPRVMREWLGHLIMYSMTITLSGLYTDYFTLGQGLLRMVGDIHHVDVTDDDVDELKSAMLSMPAHPDVESGLGRLRDAGFQLVSLTNSPPNPDGPTPLEKAGLADYIGRQFSVGSVRAYKPAAGVYHLVAQELDVPASSCMMVAAHVWDTIGAQAAGFTSALVTRPGNAPLPIPSLPQPNLVVPDLPALADALAQRWPG